MIKIGITGGIGSGKTTVCEIFKLLGIPVFHADLEAKNIQNNDESIKRIIKNLLGCGVYTDDGKIDRIKMAGIIFNDKKLLSAVNEIIHPAVKEKFLKWSEIYQSVPYLLYEAAILFESGNASDFNRNILVLSDEKLRIERVIKRDHTTEEIVRQRISNQFLDTEKVKMTDFLIDNNNQSLLIPQVLKLDKIFREDGKNW